MDGSFFMYCWDSPWFVDSSWPNGPVWRVIDLSRQYGWLIVPAYQYGWVIFHAVRMADRIRLSVRMGHFSSYKYIWVDFSWPDGLVWTVLGPSMQYRWLIAVRMADRTRLSVRMGQFFMACWTSLGRPWSFKAVRMADRISLPVRMGHFSSLDGTSPDSPWQYGWLIVQAYQYVWVIFHYEWVDFSWPDRPGWTVLGPSRQYGWLIVSSYHYVWVIFHPISTYGSIFHVLMGPVQTVHAYQDVWVDFSWPDGLVWTILGPSMQYGWRIVSAYQYVWVIFHVDLGPSRQCGWLIISAYQYVWVIFQAVRVADCTSLSVGMGHFSSYQYVWVDFSWPDRPGWTVLGPSRHYGWLIVSAYHLSGPRLIISAYQDKGLEAVNQADLLSRIKQGQGLDENLQKVARNERTEYQVAQDGTSLVHGRISVPNVRELKEEIMGQSHKSKFSVHPGLNNMYKDMKRCYHWVRMKTDVAEWVAKCPTCQLVTAEHQVPSGLLQNLPIPEWKWDHITMDFVSGFPTTRNRKDSVWVVVDRLTKSAHFIPIK
ncbi:hypothetical protein N665_1121s0001 [Sinapis alba]|nr:hypothetical protein N665_1121s0001 [Sinapis alba]